MVDVTLLNIEYDGATEDYIFSFVKEVKEVDEIKELACDCLDNAGVLKDGMQLAVGVTNCRLFEYDHATEEELFDLLAESLDYLVDNNLLNVVDQSYIIFNVILDTNTGTDINDGGIVTYLDDDKK